jgi:hypothetical protein
MLDVWHLLSFIQCSDEQAIPEMNYNFVKIADMDKHEKGALIGKQCM